MCLVDYLRSDNLIQRLQKVTLIEPSDAALTRAKFNVSHAVDVNSVFIETENYYLPSTERNDNAIGGLHIEEPICIHLFSNILDIPDLDLKELALLTGNSGYKQYFLCVGPMNFGNNRIDAFSQYFKLDRNAIFSDVRSAQYGQISNGKWYSCVTKGFQVIREDGKPFLVPLTFYPSKQFHASYKLDAIQTFEEQTKESAFWNRYSAFEVLSPFDIGASIYEDIHPILAVLSNIITRGLPTKCSPFIEETINDIFHFSHKTERYSTVKYSVCNEENLIEHEELLRKVPICVARIQKVIIEALLTKRISTKSNKWIVLVKECDVPCAAIAFEDLKMMFNHLVSMTQDYCNIRFPDMELHILYSKSSKEIHF